MHQIAQRVKIRKHIAKKRKETGENIDIKSSSGTKDFKDMASMGT